MSKHGVQTATLTEYRVQSRGCAAKSQKLMETCENCYYRYDHYCPVLDASLPDLAEKCDAWREMAPTDWSCEKD